MSHPVEPRGGPAAWAQRRPHPALRPYVHSYHGYRVELGTPRIHRGLPSTSLTVLLLIDEPLEVAWPGETAGRFWTLASGLHTRPALVDGGLRQQGIQLALTPRGARSLLGVSAAELAGELVAMDDLIAGRARRLQEEVAASPTWDARFGVLDEALLRLLGQGRSAPVRPEVQWAWRRIRGSGGRAPVGELCREVGWSAGHLARAFAREYGVGPKAAGRLARFERAGALLRQPGRPALAEAAGRCGYADQSHLTREWNALAGCSPSRWVREEVDFVQDRVAPGVGA